MANRISNLANAFETTLAAEMSSVATSMTLTDATGLTQPFYLVIEPDSPTQREYVYVDSLAGVVASVSERYLAGSAAGSGLTHPVASVVRMAAFAQNIEDLHDRVDDAIAQITAGGDHGGLTGLADDDHTQYLTTARHTALSGDHVTGGDSHTHLEAQITDLAHTTDHGALGGLADDDHSQYYNAARHTKALHDGLALDHGALTGLADDDHSQYLNTSRHDADDHSALESLLVTYHEPGTLTVKTGTVGFPLPYDCTITRVQCYAATGPTGADVIVDVNVDGVTIDTGTKPRIVAGAQLGQDTAFTDATHNRGQIVTIDIDQIGSTVAGADLTVNIIGTRV